MFIYNKYQIGVAPFTIYLKVKWEVSSSLNGVTSEI